MQKDEDEGQGEDAAHDNGKVAAFEGVDHEFAGSAPAEDGFDKNGSGQKAREPARDGGDQGIERVAQHVAAKHLAGSEAFGVGGAHVVETEDFEGR